MARANLAAAVKAQKMYAGRSLAHPCQMTRWWAYWYYVEIGCCNDLRLSKLLAPRQPVAPSACNAKSMHVIAFYVFSFRGGKIDVKREMGSS